MSRLDEVKSDLSAHPKRWLITGVAGFIGSNLLETLLSLGQSVTGLDNFSTGNAANLADVHGRVGDAKWQRFHFVEGDILDADACKRCCEDVKIILHQAALNSVPRSIKNPLQSHLVNVDGFLNILMAARDVPDCRVVFASSSSVYGDITDLPKVEHRVGAPLSPYATTKQVNELYANIFARCYGTRFIGLRYFNVFGPRQNPAGEYSAVIPRWIKHILAGETCVIYGDGETSRDFCHVDNVVSANLLAALADDTALNQFYNIACGASTTLNQLFAQIRAALGKRKPALLETACDYRPFRDGDVRHALADISKAERALGYSVRTPLAQGLDASVDWYIERA